jgi:hypothetical protein
VSKSGRLFYKNILNNKTISLFLSQEEAAIVRAKSRHALAVAGRAHRLANSDAGAPASAVAGGGGENDPVQNPQ